MRLTLWYFTLPVTISSVCLAQPWELGASGGYGWYQNPSIANSTGSAQAGIPPRAAFGVTFTQNMYNYVGGEIRYLFRFGGPELKSSGMEANLGGHTNLVTYDFLFYTSPKEPGFVHMSPGAQESKCTLVWDPVFSVSTSHWTTLHFCGQ
jgi:hypothetical protein